MNQNVVDLHVAISLDWACRRPLVCPYFRVGVQHGRNSSAFVRGDRGRGHVSYDGHEKAGLDIRSLEAFGPWDPPEDRCNHRRMTCALGEDGAAEAAALGSYPFGFGDRLRTP